MTKWIAAFMCIGMFMTVPLIADQLKQKTVQEEEQLTFYRVRVRFGMAGFLHSIPGFRAQDLYASTNRGFPITDHLWRFRMEQLSGYPLALDGLAILPVNRRPRLGAEKLLYAQRTVADIRTGDNLTFDLGVETRLIGKLWVEGALNVYQGSAIDMTSTRDYLRIDDILKIRPNLIVQTNRHLQIQRDEYRIRSHGLSTLVKYDVTNFRDFTIAPVIGWRWLFARNGHKTFLTDYRYNLLAPEFVVAGEPDGFSALRTELAVNESSAVSWNHRHQLLVGVDLVMFGKTREKQHKYGDSTRLTTTFSLRYVFGSTDISSMSGSVPFGEFNIPVRASRFYGGVGIGFAL